MKKLFVIIGLCVLAGFLGCKSTQPIVEAPKDLLKLEGNKYKVFTQRLLPNVKKEDGLIFYNGTEIKLTGSITKYYPGIRNGAIFNMDTTFNLFMKVPAITEGTLLEAKRDNKGVVYMMTILFSKKDETYTLTFFLEKYVKYLMEQSGGSYNPKIPDAFILSGKATILFRGEKCNVEAQADKECRLFVDDQSSSINEDIVDEAEGYIIYGNSGQNNQQPGTKTKTENNNDIWKPSLTPLPK